MSGGGDGQHVVPCHDCPWRRDSHPGHLGGYSPKFWTGMAHAEAVMSCHIHLDTQCAGAAIYRRNVAKRCRNKDVLVLDADRQAVFASPQEFHDHHGGPLGTPDDVV